MFALRCLIILLFLTYTCLPILSAPALRVIGRESLKESDWNPEEANWIREHVGCIFYGSSDPNYSQRELIDLAHSMGLRSVKTWLKGFKPDEMLATLKTPDYRRICSEFDTVLFDVCPDFVKEGYDEQMSRTIRREYRDVAYYLATEYRGTGKTFLLSIFMENNLFFGTQRSHLPDIPPDRFFRDAVIGVKSGVARALAEKAEGELPKIYTVIEIAGLPREFIERYIKGSRADLYAISYYGRGELGQQDVTLQDCIDALREVVPHDGPFGKDNIILGELGRNVFAGKSEGYDQEQLQYLRKTLSVAKKNRLPYAFVFWLADQERHLDDGWGFVSSKPTGSKLRRSWHAFQSVFGGSMPASRPAVPHPDVDFIIPDSYNVEPGRKVRVRIGIANRSTLQESSAPADDVKVEVVAGQCRYNSMVSLAPDELVVLESQVPAPEDGDLRVTLSTAAGQAVTRTASLNRADIVVDRIYTEPASPRAGEDVRIFAVVRNVGKREITDFAVQFHIDNYRDQWVTWGCIWGDTRLKPGESLPIGGGFLWKAIPGKHRARAWANPDGSRESDYSNNILWHDITVGELSQDR